MTAKLSLSFHYGLLYSPAQQSLHKLPPSLLNLPSVSSRGEKSQLKLQSPPIGSKQITIFSRASIAAVTATLPTQKFSSEETPGWSSRAIRSFALGELEARRLRYPNTGTEALLLGILFEGTSAVAQFLRANGVTLFKVRDEAVNLMGKSECLYNSPEHPKLTEQAQRALDSAIEEKLKSGKEGEITVTHIFLGIWSNQKSAARQIMENLGFNDERAKELIKSVQEKSALGFE